MKEDIDVLKDGTIIGMKGRPLKPRVKSNGYCQVSVKEGGKFKNKHVHRLVAEKYIPNPLNLETVNHKDGNKLNNSVENLEWQSLKDNRAHSEDTLGNKHKDYNVMCYNKNTGEGVVFSSRSSVSKFGYDRAAVLRCCQGKVKTHRKLVWSRL